MVLFRIYKYYKDLIVTNRGWIYLTFGIFAVGVVAGLLLAQSGQEEARKIISQYAASVDRTILPGWELTKTIFVRNVSVVLSATITSLVLGLTSAFVVLVNGFILGIFVGFGEIYTRLNPWQLFLLLFPHGIFEYSGFFLGLSFGVRLGLNWLKNENKGKRRRTLGQNIKETAAILILVVVILGLAAFVEGFLTLKIACLLSGACQKG